METNGSGTLAKFYKIKTGITYQQVKAIIGVDGTVMPGVPGVMPETRTIMYQWEGNSLGANAMIKFQNNSLIQKSRFGLK
jgi:hypothetical protein